MINDYPDYVNRLIIPEKEFPVRMFYMYKDDICTLIMFGTAFANPLPSFHPVDLLLGLSAGVLLKLAVYVKGKNRK